MVRLREISRTAAFAWSPGATTPQIVTGTRAGAVDADFSDETKLELWDLSLDDEGQALELQQPIASISTDSRFFDLAWGAPSEDYPKGVIAGALENGSLDLWDVEKLASGSEDALISRTTKHTGPIKSLQFNPLRPQILATAGVKGELFIYDVNDPDSAFRLGNAAARSDDLESVAWNPKVSHILATGGTGGFVTVWDLKTKKASLTLNNNRKSVSAVAWDPTSSTRLITATPDDTTPLILLWNLRNSNAPEKTLQGHEQGVLSLDWCHQDPEILISCGKDNRTLVWNPQTGERFGEFPEVTNWTFLTRFHPHNANLSATASFDGKITIQTLQNTNPSAPQTQSQNALDGEDFFTQAQTQPKDAAFSLTKAPQWFQKPVGVSFGFGGKIITFKANPSEPGQPKSSQIQISNFSADPEIGTATDKFEESLKSGDIVSICESHVEEAKTDEEKADWEIMKTLLSDNSRKKVVEYLEVDKDDQDKEESTEEKEEETAKEPEPKKSTLEVKRGHKKSISKVFADGADNDEDDFLASLSATKGAKTDNPFQLFGDGDSSADKKITRALMLGNFEKATEVCLEENRMADAFMIANCGGQNLVDRVQSAYLSQKTGMPSYLRLLGAVIVKNLWDVVYNADLDNWKETMVALCTFADPVEFPDLCEALGDRIYESGDRKDASFCFLVGSKLEKVIEIWVAELEEVEKAALAEGNDTGFSIHARTLQQFIEKVTVARLVTKFQDGETGLTEGWKLADLYNKYVEYAEIIAGQGQLEIAQKYLELLPTQYSDADTARERVRLATRKAAPQAARAAVKQPTVGGRSSSRPQPGVQAYTAPQATANPYAPAGAPMAAPATQPAANPYPSSNPYAPSAPAANPYAPAAPAAVSNPYAPAVPAVSNPYAPAGSTPASNPYAPTQQFQQPGQYPPAQGGAPYNQPVGPPPRSGTPSSRPPPSRSVDAGSWNDVPIVPARAPPRRATPSMAPSPFSPQAGAAASPPPTGPPYGSQRATPPPPPKAGQAPPRVMSPLSGPPQAGQMPPPPSAAPNPYAPPPAAQTPSGGPSLPPPPMGNMVPRTASPYNPPPPGAAPSNRYAPAPAAQTSQPPPQPGMAPPPPRMMQGPPPAANNPYAPQQPPAQNPYAAAPTPSAAPPPVTGPPPMAGPPRAGPPPMAGTAPPPQATGSPAPPPAAAPPKAKHPAGDRSHIPANAQGLVNILEQDMQRVAGRAPASFAAQVKDTQKRLGLLFDALNNEELVKPDTIEQLSQLASAIEARDYPEASRLQVEIHRDKAEECGQWMVGVKRLIQMSKVTN